MKSHLKSHLREYCVSGVPVEVRHEVRPHNDQNQGLIRAQRGGVRQNNGDYRLHGVQIRVRSGGSSGGRDRKAYKK